MPRPAFIGGPPLERPWAINRGSPQTRNLVAWWPTIDTPGSALFELTGKNTAAIINNSPTVATESTVGKCLTFNGSSNRISTPTVGGLSEFAVSFWVRRNADTGDWQMIFEDSSSDSSPSFESDDTAGGTGYSFWVNAADNISVTLALGTLYHVVVQYSDTNDVMGVAVNGVLTERATTTTETLGGISWAGRRSDAFFAPVSLADLRVYDRYLTRAEIWALYDPQTRWEMYRPLTRQVVGLAPAAAAAGATPTRMLMGVGT